MRDWFRRCSRAWRQEKTVPHVGERWDRLAQQSWVKAQLRPCERIAFKGTASGPFKPSCGLSGEVQLLGAPCLDFETWDRLAQQGWVSTRLQPCEKETAVEIGVPERRGVRRLG